MGARQSTNSLAATGSVSNSPRIFSNSSARPDDHSNDHSRRLPSIPGHIDLRQRARSLSSVINGAGNTPSGSSSRAGPSFFGMSGLSFGFGNALDATSPDSDTSTEDLSGTNSSSRSNQPFSAHSLPVQFVPFNGLKCPVCSKTVLPDDLECHLAICLTKPRINYNEDVLMEDKGVECVICLEELNQGETIARLPCLCIYHKKCIDAWFEVNRSCPEHPSD